MSCRGFRRFSLRAQALSQSEQRPPVLADSREIFTIREELDRIVETLSGALGLGGRARRIGSAAERARSAVTWRIRSAIRKIAAAHPRLGRHLDNSVRTGTFCAYEPETAVNWDVRDESS